MIDPQPMERLIVALDSELVATARAIWASLKGVVFTVKVSTDIVLSPDFPDFVYELRKDGCRIIADLKALQTQDAVKGVLLAIESLALDAVSVYFDRDIVAQACGYCGVSKILTPILHTTTPKSILDRLSVHGNLDQIVLKRVKLAMDWGVDGVITSGVELAGVRREFGGGVLCLVPGIRDGFVESLFPDNQHRTVSIEEALAGGATYVVVGRPITFAKDVRVSAIRFQERITQFIQIHSDAI